MRLLLLALIAIAVTPIAIDAGFAKLFGKAQGGRISAHIRPDTQGTARDMLPLDQYLALDIGYNGEYVAVRPCKSGLLN
ncbi:hypothetical protein MTO96_045467 [Rhipicephalus appendiculatus]